VQGFAAALLQNQERARRAGTRPRAEHTIDKALATVRDLAQFVGSHRNKLDWALVDVHDFEAFLVVLPKSRRRRLTVLRQFFRFARTHKVVLVDPTRGLAAKSPRGFTGRTLLLDRQRDLFRRWTTDPTAHPHEALLGILALLHGASSQEVRLLRCEDVEPVNRTVRLGRRPQPVPLDPASWSLLQRCLAHRSAQRTENPHVVVTRGTKARKDPASAAYFTHLLDRCGIPPKMVRCTRLAELVNTMDPKLVAAAFGMNPEGVTFYLTDHVDDAGLPAARANLANP
jgi:integrase